MDIEAQNAAEAIAIYKAVTGKGDAAYSREKSTEKWEHAAIAASVARSKHPHSAVQTLSKIGAVAACFGHDWPDVPGEPEILRRVKWAARQLQAARALPATSSSSNREFPGLDSSNSDQWKCGNEFLPYHPSASHVEPAYRDGWNACYKAAAQVLAMGRVPVTGALKARCVEILEWQKTGILTGNALRDFAAAKYPEHHDALQMAERETAKEAFSLIAADPRPPAAQEKK